MLSDPELRLRTSASVVLWLTVGCSFDCQLIGPPQNVATYLDVDRLVSAQFAKLESVYPIKPSCVRPNVSPVYRVW